jgi:hypothetical protein
MTLRIATMEGDLVRDEQETTMEWDGLTSSKDPGRVTVRAIIESEQRLTSA